MKLNCDFAVYGLGVMGASLARNMLSKGYRVAVYTINKEERVQFKQNNKYRESCIICDSEEEMLQSLLSPRKIFLIIMAGNPVDMVLNRLLPCLNSEDVLIDGGNSYYKDTILRYQRCEERGIHFLGIGVSGGEKGAFTGPSMMVGGSKKGWEYCQEILQHISAHHKGIPCCVFLGNEAAGHYVKMIHNGIEYGILQLISETYHYLKDGMNIERDEIIKLFSKWKENELASYLMDISIQVLEKKDEKQNYILDYIQDRAGQKGTGLWTLQESLEAGIYAPTIYEAVQVRSFSTRVERKEKEGLPKGVGTSLFPAFNEEIEQIFQEALYWGMVCCYSQGLELIQYASKTYHWDISILDVIQVWKEGCIIRSALLEDIQAILVKHEGALVLSKDWKEVGKKVKSLRQIVSNGYQEGYLCASYASVLNYYTYFQTDTMPVSFLQGLRDCFGAHTYKRKDIDGDFHTKW